MIAHIAALMYWLYLTYVARHSANAGDCPKKAFKSFKIVYDFEEMKPPPNTALQPKYGGNNPFQPHKRNRSFADITRATI